MTSPKMVSPPAEKLKDKRCTPCNAKTLRLAGEETIRPYLNNLDSDWYVADGMRIRRKFKLKDFKENIQFVNRIAELAEEQGHHPDLNILYDILEVSLWTHAIGGLSDNDFIMAAKITEFYNKRTSKRKTN